MNMGKRTIWIILGLTAALTIIFSFTMQDLAKVFAGAFIGFASSLLPEKKS